MSRFCMDPVLVALMATLAACGDGGGEDSDLQCITERTVVERLCTPPTAQAGASLTIELQESCGTCVDRQPTCTSSVAGAAVELTVTNRACVSQGGPECPAMCAQRYLSCSIPPLAAGTYQVTVNAGAPRAQLTVAAGGQASCVLPKPI